MKQMKWYNRLAQLLAKAAKEDDGAVMMEYVLLGITIALAVLVGAGVLGYAIKTGFASLSEGAVNKPKTAGEELNEGRGQVDKGIEDSQKHLEDISPEIQ